MSQFLRIRQWLSKYEMLPIVRFFSSVLYLGPWRRPIVVLLKKVHKSRTVSTGEESNIVEIDRATCSERLRKTGFSGTFIFSPSLIDEVVTEMPTNFDYLMYNPHLTSPAMRRIMYDPHVISLVTDYLGVAPHVKGSSLSIINRENKRQKPEGEICTKRFHYDVGDFSSVTLFVYLNDVEADGGAHVVIPSTHRHLMFSKYWSRFLDYHVACQRYGDDQILAITGVKGTAFLEDLANWHKRGITNRCRSCLSVTYTMDRTH